MFNILLKQYEKGISSVNYVETTPFSFKFLIESFHMVRDKIDSNANIPFRFLFLSGMAIVGVAPLGGTRAVPGATVEPRIAADFSGVKASTSLSL